MNKFLLLFILPLLLISCKWGLKTIEGNGKIVTQTKEIALAEKLVFKGDFDVVIQSAPTTSVAVETDENIQNLVLITETNGSVVFQTKQKFNIQSDHGIKIFINTPKLESVNLAGSGNVKGVGKFLGASKLMVDIAGNGEVELDVNTPKIVADIAGIGKLKLSGETKEAKISIAGNGECDAIELKSENALVKVAGVGTVSIFAAVSLDIEVAGSGTVNYKGTATVKQKIAGVGSIKKID